MTKELWNEIKSASGADKNVAYRITVINGKEEAKIEFKADGSAVLTNHKAGAIDSGYTAK